MAGKKQAPEMQTAFAKRLEEVLFKTSKSVEAYSDPKTLDRRLQRLLSAMQKRKAGKATGSSAVKAVQQKRRRSSLSIKSPQDLAKQEVLLRVLGQAKMTQVFKIIAEIKLIQLGRKVTAGNPYASIPQCTRHGCSVMIPCQGDEAVPPPVRNLFFKTAIIAAYEKSSAEQLPGLPWDQLLAQGEARLAAYHEWFQERQLLK